MQTIRIGLAFETCAHIFGIQCEQHVIPTLRFGTQFGLAQRSLDSIFGIHKSDCVCFDMQSVHTQFIEWQGERCGIHLLHRVGRSDECTCQVRRAVRCDVEINLRIVQYGFMHMQVAMVEKLRHIHCGCEVLCLYDGVVLCTGFGIEQQQSISTQTETREGGEECQVHLSYLIRTGNEFVCCLAGDRCQACRREDNIHRNACNRHHRQHQA